MNTAEHVVTLTDDEVRFMIALLSTETALSASRYSLARVDMEALILKLVRKLGGYGV